MLTLRKQQILEICKKYKIPFVEDATNQNPATSTRNMIRLKYLPSLYHQQGFETYMKKIYAAFETRTTKDLLLPISLSPFRKAKTAYRLCIPKQECTSDDLQSILKQLHASSGMDKKMLDDFSLFIQKASKGWKIINGITFFISHGEVYIFQAPVRFREKTVDKQKKIDSF